MILNINDLSKFYGDHDVAFIKTAILTKEEVVGIIPTNNMGSLMDLILYELLPINADRIYIIGHFLDEITLEELEVFIDHLINTREFNIRDIVVVINYHTSDQIVKVLESLGVNTLRVYYHLNIKDLDITMAHTEKLSLEVIIKVHNCEKEFDYSIINYAYSRNKMRIVGCV